VAKELNASCHILDLHAMEPQDLMGLPYVENKITRHARPEFLPNEDEAAFLVLDEVNRITPDMESPLYGLLVNRQIGEHKIGNKCLILAACNPSESDNDTQYNVNEFDAALEGRFRMFGVAGDVEGWHDWMYETHGSSEVLEFCIADPDVVSFTGKRGTPRDFENLYKSLKAEGELSSMEDETITGVAAGDIGLELASHFTSFLTLRSYCTPDMILHSKWDECEKGLEKAQKQGRFDIASALMRSVADRWLRDEKEGKVDNLVNFLEFLKAERGFTCVQLMINKEAQSSDVTMNRRILKMVKEAKTRKSPLLDWAADIKGFKKKTEES